MQHNRNCKVTANKNKNKLKQPMNCSKQKHWHFDTKAKQWLVSGLLTPSGATKNVFEHKVVDVLKVMNRDLQHT